MGLHRNTRVHRLFGGKPASPLTIQDSPLLNEGDQTQYETLTVGTSRRVCKGPGGQAAFWSYHLYNNGASGATSNIKIYFSDLPNPDPTDATHWKDSGITAIDLTVATTGTFATRPQDYCEWIKFEATVASSGGTLWGYVRVTDDGQG